MGGRLGALIAAGLAGLTLSACDLERGDGYVEIKTAPPTALIAPVLALALDGAKLDPVRKGQAIIRTRGGSHKLQVEGQGGPPIFLCDLVVRKNRITTVTVLDRPPRCLCRNAAGTDPPANRTCVS